MVGIPGWYLSGLAYNIPPFSGFVLIIVALYPGSVAATRPSAYRAALGDPSDGAADGSPSTGRDRSSATTSPSRLAALASMIPGLGFLSPFAPSDNDVISPGSRGSKRSRADANLDDDVFVRDEEIARRHALLLKRDVARIGLLDPAREFIPA
jgi:hypothetical protein